MSSSLHHRRHILLALASALLLVLFGILLHNRHGMTYGLPYADRFKAGDISGWTAFGGTWQVSDAAVQNNSDERGAKLLTGSPYWTDYTLESDVRLDGDSGDAGLLLRVQEPDEGVDAYHGFYTGLRLRDNALIAGQADYGWTELSVKPLTRKLHPLDWYHLRATIEQCRLRVRATTIDGQLLAELTLEASDCSKHGQIGLRSYASGGSWRDVRAYPPASQPGKS